MSNLIGDDMEKHGIKFIKCAIPSNIEETSDGKRKVTWKNTKSDE